MFQAPRPISHAPNNTNFTPSAAPTSVPPFPSQATSGGSHAPHIVAVPLPVTHAHRPIAVSAHRISTSGSSGPNSASFAGNRAHHFASRPHLSDSPVASPLPNSASASPAVHMSQAGSSLSAGGVGFSLSTPSPPPQPAQTPTQSQPHSQLFISGGETPSSPMLASPAFGIDRRDSADENEAASANLQGILWRNAPARGANVSRVHVPHVAAYGLPSPGRSVMSPATPNHALPPSTPPSQSGAFSRAIPIARPRSGTGLQPQQSILGLMHHSYFPSPTATGSVNASEELGAATSLDNSRRSSASGTTQQNSFVAGTSPQVGTPGSSYIISHTPPVRAGNPVDRDSCFSPAQQAEYLMKLAANGIDEQTARTMLPMVTHSAAYPRQSSYASVQQSPVLRPSQANAIRIASQRMPNKFSSPQMTYVASSTHTAVPPPLQSGGQVDEDGVDYPKLSCTC